MLTNWLAFAVFACCAPFVRDARTVTLFAITSLSVFWPMFPSDPGAWYWLVFCADMSVALLALIINSPSSQFVCLMAASLCLTHMAGATVIPVGLDPDPYTIIVQTLEALLILSCIKRKGPSWDGRQSPRLLSS